MTRQPTREAGKGFGRSAENAERDATLDRLDAQNRVTASWNTRLARPGGATCYQCGYDMISWNMDGADARAVCSWCGA